MKTKFSTQLFEAPRTITTHRALRYLKHGYDPNLRSSPLNVALNDATTKRTILQVVGNAQNANLAPTREIPSTVFPHEHISRIVLSHCSEIAFQVKPTLNSNGGPTFRKVEIRDTRKGEEGEESPLAAPYVARLAAPVQFLRRTLAMSSPVCQMCSLALARSGSLLRILASL